MVIAPDPVRARAVETRMCVRLSHSLLDIARQSAGVLSFPALHLAEACHSLARGQAVPGCFAVYCELVLALQAGDLLLAEQLFDEIARHVPAPASLRVWRFRDPDTDPDSRRYARFFDTDPEQTFVICPPDAGAADACEARVNAALALLAHCDPCASEELQVLLKEIVLASGAEAPDALRFDGASSFMLFGAILLNVRGHETVLQTLEALIHESSHNLLFGLCADGGLTENAEGERYASPLRLDPRPMDGIVHATFVLARMHQGIQRLLDSGRLDADQTDEARSMLSMSVRQYASGWQTVRQYAKLTALGETLMRGTQTYMAPHLARH